jgi:hypothetical protein
LMIRKLSVTESQNIAQFFGTSSRKNCRTDLQKSVGRVAPIVGDVLMHQAP